MAGTTVKITGLNELWHRLNDLPRKGAKAAVTAGLKAGGGWVLDGMKREVPVDTSFLKQHLNMTTRTNSDLGGWAFMGPVGRVDYPYRPSHAGPRYKQVGKRKFGRIAVVTVARFLEFGTRKMKANPFMSRAAQMTRDTAVYRAIAAMKTWFLLQE